MQNLDEDFVALALIVLLGTVWISAIWKEGDTTRLAADVLNFGIGAIAGYMTRNRPE